MELDLNDIISACNGLLEEEGKAGGLRGDLYKGVSIDTRTIGPGELFIALKGPRFDAHDHLVEALKKGASTLVVGEVPDALRVSGEERGLNSGASIVVVKDTLRALGDIAAFLRDRYPVPLLAISGSAGKTTTKDMANLILSAEGKEVLKTEGNKNNLVGLPLTLMGLDSTIDLAVVELGISLPGEMARLTEICKPDVSLITNIGCSHTETLGGIEGVASEKGMLFNMLARDGVKVVNINDKRTVKLADLADELMGKRGERVTFSTETNEGDVFVSEVTDFGLDGTRVVYDVLGEDIEVRFNAPGLANIKNGAAAIAATVPLAAKPEAMRLGLNAFMPESGRMVVVSAGSVTIIDDTYNANPESLRVAIETLSRTTTRQVAIIGEMMELGKMSKTAHFEAGARLAASGVDAVVGVGRMAEILKDGALSEGMTVDEVFTFGDNRETIEGLVDILEAGDTVLVKGSRGAMMEEIVFAISGFKGQS